MVENCAEIFNFVEFRWVKSHQFWAQPTSQLARKSPWLCNQRKNSSTFFSSFLLAPSHDGGSGWHIWKASANFKYKTARAELENLFCTNFRTLPPIVCRPCCPAERLTLVLLASDDLFVGSLHLEDELDTLDGSDGGLRHGSWDTTSHEVLSEAHCVFFLLFCHLAFFSWIFLLSHTTKANSQLFDSNASDEVIAQFLYSLEFLRRLSQEKPKFSHGNRLTLSRSLSLRADSIFSPYRDFFLAAHKLQGEGESRDENKIADDLRVALSLTLLSAD